MEPIRSTDNLSNGLLVQVGTHMMHHVRLRVIDWTTGSRARIYCENPNQSFSRIAFTRRQVWHRGNTETRFVLLNRNSNNESVTLYTCLIDAEITAPPDPNHVCCICLEDSPDETLECNHSFCRKCIIQTAVKNGKRCPCCRAQFTVPTKMAVEYIQCLETECLSQTDELLDLRDRVGVLQAQLRIMRAISAQLVNEQQS